MSSSKPHTCQKCGVKGIVYYMPHHYAVFNNSGLIKRRYTVCIRCWDEWYNNGYDKIWWSFYNTCSYELADKLVLDFLGKLGE